jgi:hypothetical protein
MEPTVIVAFVTTQTSPEESIRRLVHATAHIEGMLSRSALNTLIQLTAMAHRTGGEGDIVSASFPTADLDRLDFLGFIKLDDNSIAIELI